MCGGSARRTKDGRMLLYTVRHISVSIRQPFDTVYAFLADPENFPTWASGLSHAFRRVTALEWIAETPNGPITVRFTDRNPCGIAEHSVITECGTAMHNPMRVFANGDGS